MSDDAGSTTTPRRSTKSIERSTGQRVKVVAYLDSAGSGDYLVAAGCDEVVMPESGVLMLLGVISGQRRLRCLLRSRRWRWRCIACRTA